jgi:predicted Zn-dependent protease
LLALSTFGVVAMVVLFVVVPRMGAVVARQFALSRMSTCEFSPARRWLAWSAWLNSGDYRTDLLLAACHRQGMQMDAWAASLDEAERKGAPHDSIAVEAKLGQFQADGLYEGAEAEMPELAAAGVPRSDILTVFLRGFLARRNVRDARLLLETTLESFPDGPQRDYLWGVFFVSQGDPIEAESRLTSALRAQPGHELARNLLADVLAAKNKPARALQEYTDLAIRSGGSEKATLGMARELRQLARVDEARTVLAPLASQPDPGPLVQLEMAQIELESGNYEEAERRFAQIQLDKVMNAPLAQAAITIALRKKPIEAEALFAKAATEMSRNGWIAELQVRLAKNPADRAAAEELERLSRPSLPLTPDLPGSLPQLAADSSAAAAAGLYRLHCSVCHGPKGDGRGQAAYHLFPRPRDLRTGRCQLVSTRNGVPTLEDIERVLELGMFGTSMQSFRDLPESDRRLLAQEVLRLRREGLRDQIAAAFRQEGEEVDEADLRHAVECSTTPGERVRLPTHWPDPGQAVAKGKASYAALGCTKCHGDDGTGAADQFLFDDLGEPSRPRDLVHEPFKGGREPESICLRIAAGMPGTAHPAALNLPVEQLIELVDYVRSLACPPEYQLTNHERRARASTPSYLHWLKESSDARGRSSPSGNGIRRNHGA